MGQKNDEYQIVYIYNSFYRKDLLSHTDSIKNREGCRILLIENQLLKIQEKSLKKKCAKLLRHFTMRTKERKVISQGKTSKLLLSHCLAINHQEVKLIT